MHVLWEWLLRTNTRKHYAKEIYRRTVTAIRAYLRNGQLNVVKPASDDIFEWDSDYKTMIQPRRNQWTDFSKKKQTEESFLENE